MTSALRGEGVPSKADIVSNLSKGGFVNFRENWGEGVKKIQNIRGRPKWKPPRSKSGMTHNFLGNALN